MVPRLGLATLVTSLIVRIAISLLFF
jgi:hypothetical protein